MHGIADFIDIPGPDAFLNVGQPRALRMFPAQQIRHQRVHSGRSEKNGRIVIRDQRCAFDDSMSFGTEKIDIFFTKFSG